MKYPDEIPNRGIIKILVHFEGYRDDYQNATRKILSGDNPNNKYPSLLEGIKSKECKIEPRDFSLLRKVVGNRGRAIGASHTYKYQIEGDPSIFIENLKKRIDEVKKKWWRKVDLYLEEKIKVS